MKQRLWCLAVFCCAVTSSSLSSSAASFASSSADDANRCGVLSLHVSGVVSDTDPSRWTVGRPPPGCTIAETGLPLTLLLSGVYLDDMLVELGALCVIDVEQDSLPVGTSTLAGSYPQAVTLWQGDSGLGLPGAACGDSIGYRLRVEATGASFTNAAAVYGTGDGFFCGEPYTAVTLRFSSPSPPPQGACCVQDGSCTVTTEAACTAPDTWQAAWLTCTANPCQQPQPVRACCWTEGMCRIRTEDACLSSSGAWYAGWLTCMPNPCPQPPPNGSCCFLIGSCTVTVETGCTGTWALSGTCDPNICPAPPAAEGACCSLEGVCTWTTRDVCPEPRQWHAEWSTCDPSPCPLPQGACCVEDETCTLTTLIVCAPPAIWRSEFTACDPNPCLQSEPTERMSWGGIKIRYHGRAR